MKVQNNFTIVAIVLMSTLLFITCNNNSNQSKSNNTENSSSNQKEQPKEEESIDGIYSGSRNMSGLELTAELTISGSSWSASSQLGYDSPEYQNGIVKGKELYDASGMIKIGYVSGNTASIDGYPSMRK
jgi:uncharacterized protein with FMN-binding domain